MQHIKMDTIFMNSENSKTSKPHVLVLKLTNKLDLRIGEKIIVLSNLSIYYTWKNIKSSYGHKITINLKYLHQYGMINLNCLMVRILYQTFKIILSIFKKNKIEIKLKIEFNLTLKMGIVLNFQHLRQWNYLEALKIKKLKIKTVKMCRILKL